MKNKPLLINFNLLYVCRGPGMQCQLIFNRMYIIKEQAGWPEPASWHKRSLSPLSFWVLARNKNGICFQLWNWYERNEEIGNSIFSVMKLVWKFHDKAFRCGHWKVLQWRLINCTFTVTMSKGELSSLQASHLPLIGFDLFDLRLF